MDKVQNKQIEKAHQEWMDALDIVEDPIFMHDKDYRVLRCNKAYQQIAELPFKDIIGKPYFKIFPKTDTPLHNCVEALENSSSETKEEELKIENKVFRSRAYPIINTKGEYLYSVHILEDITKQRLTEKNLIEVENKFESIFNNARDGILLADTKTKKFISANKRICNMLGYTYEELMKLGVEYIHPKKELEFVKSQFERQAKGEIELVTLPVQRKDGTIFYADINSFPITVQDKVLMAGFFRDITEKKKALEKVEIERAFSESLIESLPDLFFLLDQNGKLLKANKKLETLFGISHQEIFTIDPFSFIDEKDRLMAFQKLQETFQKGYAFAEVKFHLTNGIRDYFLKGNRVETDQGANVIGLGIDITNQKETEQLLKQERDFSERLIQTAPVIILTLNKQGKIINFNNYMESLTGYTLDEVQGEEWFEYFIPEQDREKIRTLFFGAIDNIETDGNRNPILTKNGEQLLVEWYDKTIKDENNNTIGLLSIGMDITQTHKTEEELKLFRLLLDHSDDMIEVIDPETLLLIDANETKCKMLGYTKEELLNKYIYEIDTRLSPEFANTIETELEKEGHINFESVHMRKDGSTIPVDINATLIKLDKPYILSIARDITEKIKSQEALKNSEEMFHSITSSAQDAIIMMDDKGLVSYWNHAAEKMFDYKMQDIVGKSLHKLIAPERFLDAHEKAFKEFIKTGKGGAIGKTVELAAIRKSGEEFPIELSLSAVNRDGHWHAIGIMRDISDRKEAENALERANRALRTLSAGNIALIKAKSEQELLNQITDIIVEKGNYSLATVFYLDDNQHKTLTPIAWSGASLKECFEKNLTWNNTTDGKFPAAMAVESAETKVCRGIHEGCGCQAWKDAVADKYVSNIALPLLENEEAFGVLTIYTSEENAFTDEEIVLLEEMTADLAFGILTLRARKEHEEQTSLFRESLEQSIQTIAATVEARDPYTAGHQRRVGELATAIAEEMNLSEEQIRGIHFAAIIHDLGKIHVPAEILAKPGHLSDLEYQLIQTHPEEGYNIIKDVKFPWPIADIIHQHHEAIDGSGYPQGLKGNEILLESKIVAVADVVEAMSSHRPYRPAVGIESALATIQNGKGTIYEPSVVDACFKLFREERFHFSHD